MKNILLVDDDPVIRLLVGDYLKVFGYDIDEANGGVDCLLKLRDKIPEILILDLNMPDMTGLEVLRTLRKARETCDIPVLLLSANSDIEELAAQHNVKADLYLQKPFHMEKLREAVENLKK